MNLFGVFQLKPYWQDHYINDDYVGIKLLLGLFGYTISLWLILITLITRMSNQLLLSLDAEITAFALLFQSFGFNFLFGIFVSTALSLGVLRTNEVFEDYSFQKHFSQMQSEILQILTSNEQNAELYPETKNDQPIRALQLIQFWFIVGTQVVNGFITGFLYSLLFFIPYFILCFLTIFILGNIISGGLFLIYFSFIVAWLLIYYLGMKRRIDFKIKERPKKVQTVYPFKRRDIDILTSDEPPIVCENCRSFIPANSSSCPVCDEPVNSSSKT